MIFATSAGRESGEVQDPDLKITAKFVARNREHALELRFASVTIIEMA